MAIHEDDPCWSIFGLPRIITCEENLDKFLKLVDDKHNGITLCAGSLGCSNKNDVVHLAAKYAAMGRIHFVHMRNVAILGSTGSIGTQTLDVVRKHPEEFSVYALSAHRSFHQAMPEL